MSKRLLVLVGPSGVGKTTLANNAYLKGIATHVIRSVTDRPKGPAENNSEYIFVDKGAFNPNDCIEHAEYAGNNYGIPKSEMELALKTDRPIVAAEINGALQLKEYCNGKCDVVLAFVNASDEQLRKRLVGRGRGNVDERMARVGKDRDSMALCDVTIINDAPNMDAVLDLIATLYTQGVN